MATQVIHRGGRRFGPSALAAQGRRSADALTRMPRAGGVPPVPPGWAAAVAPPVRRQRPVSRRRAGPRIGGPDHGSLRAGTVCTDGSAPGTYRMGRWARLSMTVVVTAAIVVGTLTLALRPTATPTTFVTVQPGDTLMSIVARDMPGWDPAAAIGELEALNGLGGPAVPVGAVLRVPAADAGGR